MTEVSETESVYVYEEPEFSVETEDEPQYIPREAYDEPESPPDDGFYDPGLYWFSD